MRNLVDATAVAGGLFSFAATKIRIGRGRSPPLRLLQAKLFSFATTKNRIGCGKSSPLRPLQAGHSPLRQRRIESDADLVAATAIAGGPFSTATTIVLHRFASLALKSRIDARNGAETGKSLHRFPSLGLKSRIDASVGVVVFCRRAIFSAATKIRIGGGTRCCHGRSRRNHSPSRRRRLESDAENRSRYGRSRRAIPILCEARLSKAMPQLFKGGDWRGGEPY